MTDHDYLQTFIRSRDESAFAMMVQRHQSMVYGVCLRRLGNHDDAQDAMQNVFVKLYVGAETIQFDLAAWLRQCASNTAISFLRSKIARRKHETRWEQDSPETADLIETDESRRIVRECLLEFAGRDRELIERHLLGSQPQSRIATDWGVSQQAVAKRLVKVKRSLRLELVRRGVAALGAAVAAFLPGRVAAAAAAKLAAIFGTAKTAKTLTTAAAVIAVTSMPVPEAERSTSPASAAWQPSAHHPRVASPWIAVNSNTTNTKAWRQHAAFTTHTYKPGTQVFSTGVALGAWTDAGYPNSPYPVASPPVRSVPAPAPQIVAADLNQSGQLRLGSTLLATSPRVARVSRTDTKQRSTAETEANPVLANPSQGADGSRQASVWLGMRPDMAVGIGRFHQLAAARGWAFSYVESGEFSPSLITPHARAGLTHLFFSGGFVELAGEDTGLALPLRLVEAMTLRDTPHDADFSTYALAHRARGVGYLTTLLGSHPLTSYKYEAAPLVVDPPLAATVLMSPTPAPGSGVISSSGQLNAEEADMQIEINRRGPFWIAGAAALLTAGHSSAGTITAGGDLSAYQTLAQDSAYDSVGLMTWDGGLASGVYLGDGWVLTAAHVAESSNTLDFIVGDYTYQSQDIYLHDGWTGSVSTGNDIALVKLSGDVAGVEAAKLYEAASGGGDMDPGLDLSGSDVAGFDSFFPPRFGRHRAFSRFGGRGGPFSNAFLGVNGGAITGSVTETDDDADDLIGVTATFVGFGQTGDGLDGASGGAGEKLAGQNTIDAFGGDDRLLRSYSDSIFFVDFDDPTASSDGYAWSGDEALDLEYLIAPGDSGGGVFVEGEDGESYLLGINSFLLAFDGDPDGDYGDAAGLTYVPDFTDWIYQTTGLDTTAIKATPVPEVGTLAVLNGLSLFFITRVRRRASGS